MPAEGSAVDVFPSTTQHASAETTKPLVTATFEERWAAWQARGAAHDRAVRRKIAIAAPIIAVVAVILYALLGR
jgi:hypothetical protein